MGKVEIMKRVEVLVQVGTVAKATMLSMCLGSMLALGCGESADDHDDIDSRNAEIVDNLLAAGFAEDEIEIRESLVLDAEQRLVTEEVVLVDGDTQVTLEASRELAGESDGESFRLWRTPNLVTNPSSICLARVTSAANGYGSYVLTAAMSNSVQAARDNYAALAGFGLTFTVVNASINSQGQITFNNPGCNYPIYIYQVNGGAGGQAGFPPGGGAPFNQVQLFSGLAGLNADIHEHVTTHEIGHAIGLRHSDWKTRVSCGQNVNEGQSGAVLIPGTVDQTTNSIMAACVAGNTNGEFRGQDAAALSTLY